MSKDGLRVQYRVRKTIRTLSVPTNIVKPPPAPTHTKSGRELRPKVQSVYSYDTEPDAPLVPRVIEAWCAEVCISANTTNLPLMYTFIPPLILLTYP